MTLFLAWLLVGSMDTAQMLYAEGRFAEALPLFQQVAAEPGQDQRDAQRHEALCLYVMGLFPEARDVWQRTLARWPESRFSEDEASPEVRAFFASVPAPPPRPQRRGCGTLGCFVPFGGAQFLNNRPVKGGILMAIQAGALAANLIFHWELSNAVDADGALPDTATNRDLWVMQRASLGLLVTATAVGIVDAFWLP